MGNGVQKQVKHLQRATAYGLPATASANGAVCSAPGDDKVKQRLSSKTRAWQNTPGRVTLELAKQPIFSGYLYWLDTQGTHVWTRRWCILGAGDLHTFESADGNCLATGSLGLTEWKVKRWSGQLLHGKEYFGELVHNAYFSEFFAAETAEELNRWLDRLQSVTRVPISEINVKKEETKRMKSPKTSPQLVRKAYSAKTESNRDTTTDILRILKQRLLTEVLHDKMEIETRQRSRLKDRHLSMRAHSNGDKSDIRPFSDPDDSWGMRLKRTAVFLRVEDTRRQLIKLREQTTKKKRRITMPLVGHLRRSDDTSAAREAELHVHLAELQHELALIDALIDVQADTHQGTRAASLSDDNAAAAADPARRNGLAKRAQTVASFDCGKDSPLRPYHSRRSLESDDGVRVGDIELNLACNEIIQTRSNVTRDRPRSAIFPNDKKDILSYKMNNGYSVSYGSWPRNLATILPKQKRQPPQQFFGEQDDQVVPSNTTPARPLSISTIPSIPIDDSAPTSPISPTDHPPLRRLANNRTPTIRRSGSQPVSVVAPQYLRERTKTMPGDSDSEAKQLQQVAQMVKMRRNKSDVRKRRESPHDHLSPATFHETPEKQRRQPTRSHSFGCHGEKKAISRSRPVSFATLQYQTKRHRDYVKQNDGCCNHSLNSSNEELDHTQGVFCRSCMFNNVRCPNAQHSPRDWINRSRIISDSSATTSPELTPQSLPKQQMSSSLRDYSDNWAEKTQAISQSHRRPPALSFGSIGGSPPNTSSPRCGLTSPSMGKIAEENMVCFYADSTSGDSLLSENSKCPHCGVSLSEHDGSNENVASRRSSDDGNQPVISSKALAHIAAFEEFIDSKLIALTATCL